MFDEVVLFAKLGNDTIHFSNEVRDHEFLVKGNFASFDAIQKVNLDCGWIDFFHGCRLVAGVMVVKNKLKFIAEFFLHFTFAARICFRKL